MDTLREKLARELETVRRVPGMYILRVEPERAYSFLLGFRLAAMACGVKYESARDIWHERGYQVEATGIIPQMQRRGMDDKAIVDALIEMEIEQLRSLP